MTREPPLEFKIVDEPTPLLAEIEQLRAEVERLKAENERLKEIEVKYDQLISGAFI